jgi:alpha-2-macroglobulin
VLDDGFDRILASQLRDNCQALSALLVRPDAKADDRLPKLVRFITQSRGSRDHWENTQENVFCMNALTEYSRVFETEVPDMQIEVSDNGASIGSLALKGFQDQPKTVSRQLSAADPETERTIAIEKSGAGRYYYSVQLSYAPAALKSDPVLSGMEVRREYSVRRNGSWELLKTPFEVKTGELVKVDLFVFLPAARNFVVVNDPVPGGLEPVNRDLKNSSTVDADRADGEFAGGSAWFEFDGWVTYGVSFWSFYHKEYRHDSVRFYSDYLPAGNYHLSYVAQTVGGGSFVALPAKVEEMYDPDVYGLGVPGQLRVSE